MIASKRADTLRPDKGYIPTLDGWRTLSIAAVLACHDKLHTFGKVSTAWFYEHGNLGVDVFFAISGLLICSRLLAEERKTGSISIKLFYLRRGFRILPPAILYLLTLAVLAVVIGLPVAMPEILASLLFVRNYTFVFTHFQSTYPYYTSHFWSLAVEEHFYFFLPALLVFAPRKWRVPALFLFAGAVGIHRYLIGVAASTMHTDTRLDALLVPAAFAILLQNEDFRRRLIPFLRFWPLLALVILTVVTKNWVPRLQPLMIAWGMPFFIMGTMLRPQSLFSRFLELPWMRYIGRLSYSVYLWHVLFFVGHFNAPFPALSAVQRWPLCIVMTMACSMLSYYLIERPVIRLGHRVTGKLAAERRSARAETADAGMLSR
jgi:peptidoglycan/LPS O-acetylase OafA/YrhL